MHGSAVTVLGAASSIGIRPYDDGTQRRLDLAPNALREQGLVARLHARDLGDVSAPPYTDFARPAGRPRNEAAVAAYSRTLAQRVAAALTDDAFVVTLGGDCSIVLGCLLGVRQRHRRVGLAYIDAHADFATPDVSRTGSVASMCLALAAGRGDSILARLAGAEPLVRLDDLIVIGRRDDADGPIYGQDALRELGISDFNQSVIAQRGVTDVAAAAIAHLTRAGLEGFWIHVDADVLDPSVVPAVDSPEPGGLSAEQLTILVRSLVRHPSALGLELTIYDPQLDPDKSSAKRLSAILEQVFTTDIQH
ncbi:MAG TPA: arginase family protein [Gemmatimonadaceae bacterium]|nr:arginase family protein [Gemmatimonadaceae bacterium]